MVFPPALSSEDFLQISLIKLHRNNKSQCVSAAWDLSVDGMDLASLTRIPQYSWGKEYAKKCHGGVEEVAVPAASCCFSAGDCRLVKLEVE